MARPVRSGLGNELRLGRRCLLRTCLGISYQDVAGLVRAGLERPASVPADRHLGDLVALRVEGCDHRSRRSQGDFVLARSAAREYGHAQSASRAHPVVVVVGGGPGECWPITFGTSAWAGPLMTFTRTLDPFGTDLPAGGSVAVTWPFVFPGTMRSTGTRPWSVSACCASVHCWPLTSGTLTLGGPLETEIVTVPPFSTCEPALGFWLKTIPFL